MPLPLTVSCSSKIQIGFTFLVPAYPGCPGKEAVKWLLLLFDTVHNTPCVEERSTFYKKIPRPNFPLFFYKNTPIFLIFYKAPPISFPAYGPGCQHAHSLLTVSFLPSELHNAELMLVRLTTSTRLFILVAQIQQSVQCVRLSGPRGHYLQTKPKPPV